MITFEEAIRDIGPQDTVLYSRGLEHLYHQASQIGPSTPGAIVEIGTYRGGATKMLARMFPDRAIWGFDTFEGLPAAEGDHHEGDFAASFEEVARFLGECPNVVLVKGMIPVTLAALPPNLPLALVHLDVDLYQSTIDGLRHTYPLLAPGGFILVHDYDWSPTPGVSRAVVEFGQPYTVQQHPDAISYAKILKDASESIQTS